MDLKLICAADLHLGRYPARIPPESSADRLSGASAWERLVDRALTERVDLLLLAGDIVDEANRSYEAWGPLYRGLKRLAEQDIPVVAVAGNHDFDVLPALADEFGESMLRVLGRGGRWERWTLNDSNGAPKLHVDGWSFPRRHVDSDPTSQYGLSASSGAPVIGLIHGDLDAPDSRYAPLRTNRLRNLPPAVWILGHVHRPIVHAQTGAPILYPGSLQALDPGEEGVHGAWIVSRKTDMPWSFDQIPVSTTHYAEINVAVDGIERAEELNAHLRSVLREHCSSLVGRDGDRLLAAWCRLTLTGRTALHGRMAEALEGIREFEADPTIQLIVDPVIRVETRPALDLEDIARGNDPPARLAELLLALEKGEEIDPELLSLSEREMNRVRSQNHYADVLSTDESDPVERMHVRDVLRRQAGRLLDHLMQSNHTT